jgi:uncharacterized protein YkwD
MRRLLFLLTALTLISCNVTFVPGEQPQDNNQNNRGDRDGNDSNPPRSIILHKHEKDIFTRVNRIRKSYGKPALKWINQAIIESQDHSRYMQRENTTNHSRSRARVDRIERVENITVLQSGEIVGLNKTPALMIKAWMNSYGHRRHILGNYTHTGIGISGSGNRIFFTQIFVRFSKN